MKKKKKKSSLSVVLMIVLIIGIIISLFYLFNGKKIQVVTITDTIDRYNYSLKSNSTKLIEEYFNDLKEVLSSEVDEEEYVKAVSKLFISDYYTLSNKITNQDIGGIEFIHSNLVDSFVSTSSNTVYKYVENNVYGNRRQNLPEVKKVEVKNSQVISYEENDYIDDNGYKITLSISYKKDYDYPREATLYLIHEGEKLVIVEVE